MYYISKGIPEKNGVSEALRIVTGGQVCTLFGLDEQLWLLGYRGIATADSREQEEAVLRLQQSGLAEYTMAGKEDTMPYSDSKRAAGGAGSIRKKTYVSNGKEYTYWEARYSNFGGERQVFLCSSFRLPSYKLSGHSLPGKELYAEQQTSEISHH